MACLNGSGNIRPKKLQPDPFFKSELKTLLMKGKCDRCNLEKGVRIVICICNHKLCGKCLSKSTRSLENGKSVCVCPHCSKLEYSSWQEVDTLTKMFQNINYCTTCFDEEAVFRAKCCHLLCKHCLEHIAHDRMMTCQILGCEQMFSIKEIQDAVNNVPEILTWRYLEVTKHTSCDTYLCRNKAILRFKDCRHCYCVTCLQQVQKESFRNEDVKCPMSVCRTEFPGSVIQYFLQELRKTPLMTAVTLDLTKMHCRRCNDYCSKTMQIHNRSCSYYHAYCISCTISLKSCAQAAECPYFKSDCTEDQIKCPEVVCASLTAVKCLDAIIDTIKGKNVQCGIFVRKADLKKKCEDCRKKEAFIEFVTCSHALCEDCVNREVERSTEEDYYKCMIYSCGNFIPIRVLLQFSKSSIQNKNANIEESSVREVHVVPEVSLECMVNAESPCILLTAFVKSCCSVRVLKWMKDEKEIFTNTKHQKFIENRHLSMPSLKICDIEKNDEGLYRLIVENNHGQGVSACVPFDIPKDLPKVSISVRYDCSIKKCTVSAEVETTWPVLSAKWQKDEIDISIFGNISEYVDIGKQYILQIQNCKKKDEGLYRMIVETGTGRYYSEMNFNIDEELPTVTLETKLRKTEESLQLIANIFSKKNPATVVWLKDGKELMFDNDNKMVRKDMNKRMSILYVYDIGKEDEGEYTVVVSNSTGGYVEKKFRFEIPIGPPVVTLKMDKFQKYVVFKATVTTEWPVKNWIWKKGDVIIKDRNSKFQEGKPSTGERTLTIMKVSEEDCGWYSCVAETVAGNGKSENIQLKKVTPEISLEMQVIRKEKKLRIFSRGQPECRITNVKWFHNNHKIDLTNHAKYIQTYMEHFTGFVLGVYDVNLTDEGEYCSVIESELGKTTTNVVCFHMSKDLADVSLEITRKDKELLELTASVKSLWPVDAVRWQRNGENIVLSASEKCAVENLNNSTTKLKIKYPGQEDQGQYTLLVETVAGVTKSLSVFIEDFTGAKDETPFKSPEMKTQNSNLQMNIPYKSTINVKQPVTACLKQTKESALHGISRPYKAVVNCEICNKTASAVIQDCAHCFCLECLQFAAGSIGKSQFTITCPNSNCSSFINAETFWKFINTQHTLHLEMPLHFQVSIGKCMGRGCYNKGFIKITFCHHSLCVTCLQKCKSLSCVGNNCSNIWMPPARYFDHLLLSFQKEEETPFILRKTESLKEPWTCSACGESAFYEIIRCCHKYCKSCIGKKIVFKETMITISKCQSYDCNELYPVPKDRVNLSPDATPISCTRVSSDATTEEHMVNKKTDSKDRTVAGESLIPSSSSVSSTKRRWKGLENIAFSCYRNCILQILADTPRLYECLEDMVKQESEPWIVRLKEILCRIRNQNTAGLEMSSILHHFHYEFNNSNAGYHEYQQEDSLSFLTTVLNGLDEEYEKSKIGVKHGKKNPVDIFRGQFEDRYVCRKCKKDEHFNRSDFLSLPLLKKPTLEASFIGLLEEEEIDMFPCTTCSSTDLQKELHICSFPDVLILQINKPSELDGARREKNIDFKESLKEIKNKELLEKIRYNDIKSYKLCGVVVHRGDERGGHYISYVKRRSQVGWEECDDSLISPTILKNVLKVDAYILLYEKCESEV